MTISDDFEGDERDIMIEIVGVEGEDKSVGYHGNIEIEAYEVSGDDNGKSVKLTPLQYDRAISLAQDHMAKAENDYQESRRPDDE